MKKRNLLNVLSFLFVLYIIISMCIFLIFSKIDMIENFLTGIFFEVLSIYLCFVFILKNISNHQNKKIGYLVPIVIYTAFYMILMNVLNVWGSLSLNTISFVLSQTVLLFIYFLIVIPMYIMGKQ